MKTADESSALMDAVNAENLVEVQDLVNQGANVNKPSDMYLSPLALAITKNNTEICRFLLRNGAEFPQTKCKTLGYPLLSAVERGNIELVQLCIESGAKFQHGTYQSCPMVQSVRYNQAAMVKVLLTANSCNNGSCWYYPSLLHDALFAHNALDTARLLIDSQRFGFEFKSMNLLFILLGMTAEARFRHGKIAELLLIKGADVAFHRRYPTRNHTPPMYFMWDQRARTNNKRFQRIVEMLLLAGILPRFQELSFVSDLISIFEPDKEDREFYEWVYEVCANPEGLQNMCRKVIRNTIGVPNIGEIENIAFPPAIKDFVAMRSL